MRKLAKIAAIFFIAVAGCAALLSCGTEGPPPVRPDPSPTAPDYYVTELKVKTPPTKTAYYAGEAVDLSGITVEATWNDGMIETLSTFECKVTPVGALDYGDTAVTLQFEGVSVSYGISVDPAAMTGLSVTIPDSLNARMTISSVVDFSGVVVTAAYADGQSREVAYTANANGREIDISAVSFSDAGEKTIGITCLGRSAAFKVEVFDGLIIEAENIVEPNAITSGTVNFVERVSGSFYWFANAAEPASGGAYMGSVFKDAVMRWHVSVAEDCKANVILRAASCYMTEDGGSWSPIAVGDQQFNRMFSVSYGSAADAAANTLKPLVIGDGIVLKGGITENPEGDPRLFVNWMDVRLGTLVLRKGDNVIEMTVITDYVNCRDQFVACNIDRLEVEFVGSGGAV